MLGRKERDQLELFITGSLRQLVPDDHVLVRVDRSLDLSWLRGEVADRYCADNGRPGIDPEVAAVSAFSCLGRAVDPVQAMARVKRSPKRMAHCALAMLHSPAGKVHSFSDRFKTRKRSFRAASSVGKWPRARTARRSFEFRALILASRRRLQATR